MNKYLFLVFLGTLLVGTTSHAQSITFEFTPEHLDGGTWSHTVDGVTCTVTFDDDGTGMSIAQLTNNPTTGTAITSFVSDLGLYLGRYVEAPSTSSRTGFARPGARISFSHDVRLKSYSLGREPYTGATYCYLRGGNVTALAGFVGGLNYMGDLAFDLESLVPANTPLATCTNQPINAQQWLFKTLTVELEPYVEPVIPIPPGNETGVTRIDMLTENNYKHSYALKNGRLHVWTSNTAHTTRSRDFIFDGGESGILDFWIELDEDQFVLIETVEGYALFQQDNDGFTITKLNGNVPHDADQISISYANDTAFVMALKDGFIHFDGEAADNFVANMSAELSSGGVSQIATGTRAALAVKDGQLYFWRISGGFLNILDDIPSSVENGDILHLAAEGYYAVVQLTTGEIIPFGYPPPPSISFAEAHTSGELFAELRYENNHIIAIREDGSITTEDALERVITRTDKSSYEEGGAFYEGRDFKLKGLETFPTVVQQLGYEQLAFGEENALALLPGGRIVIWGGVCLIDNPTRV